MKNVYFKVFSVKYTLMTSLFGERVLVNKAFGDIGDRLIDIINAIADEVSESVLSGKVSVELHSR